MIVMKRRQDSGLSGEDERCVMSALFFHAC
jgi:hypothetical protein